MPKNVKKQKNAKAKSTGAFQRLLITRGPNQEYAMVKKLLGNRNVDIACFDNRDRLGIMRGNMKRGRHTFNKLQPGSIVLVCLRDFQDDKADIVHVYSLEEVATLRRMNEIPQDEGEKEDDIFFREEEEVVVPITEDFFAEL